MHAGLQNELGKGSFQELDQIAAVRPFCKAALQARSSADIAPTLVRAYQVGRPPLLRPNLQLQCTPLSPDLVADGVACGACTVAGMLLIHCP